MNRTLNRTLPTLLLLAIIYTLIIPTTAMAHVRWVIDSVTPPRTNDTGLKTKPCGGAARTNRSTIFTAGQTIELEFEETINHPGHYQIAFSPADDLNFDLPDNILVDNILDVTNNGTYAQQVTIPMQVCSACTLQLIQVMTTSPSPLPGDYYYSCSDIQITSPGDTTAPLSVSSVMSQQGDTQVTLNWNNPSADFYQVVVLKDISPIMDTPINGTLYAEGDMINGSEVVYVGKGSTFIETSLANDLPYYFKIFAQNPRKNYAAGIETNVTPSASAPGGGSTGNTPGNTGNPDNSGGGGSIHVLFWFLLLMIRLIASRKNYRQF
jgi:hypothetical protein